MNRVVHVVIRETPYAYLCCLSIDNYDELLQRVALIYKIEAKDVTFDRRSEGKLMYSRGLRVRESEIYRLTSVSGQKNCQEVPKVRSQPSAHDNQLLPSSVPIPALSIKEELIITLVIVHVRVHILHGFHISPWSTRHLLRLALGLARGLG